MKFNRRMGLASEKGPGTLYDYKYLSERNDVASKGLVASGREGSDIVAVLKTLIDIKNGNGTVDDIDHLGNGEFAASARWRRTSSGSDWFGSSVR